MKLSELQSALAAGIPFRIRGSKELNGWLSDYDGSELLTTGLGGIEDYSPEDLIITVGAGTRLDEVQQALAEKGQTLPLGWQPRPSQTVGGLLGIGGYHGLEGQHGMIRDWVLGMQVLRPDGTLASCGARVMKSVAGFDLHKLMVGSRGGLGIIVRAHLRVIPLSRLRTCKILWRDEATEVACIRRGLRKTFDTDSLRAGVIGADGSTSTLMMSRWSPGQTDGWAIGLAGYRWPSPHPLEREAKRVMDPAGMLVEGWQI